MTDEPVARRDDAGRTDDSPGFDTQAQMLTGIGVFLFAISLVYGFVSEEAAGTIMLVLAGGLVTLTAAYLGWHKPGGPAAKESERAHHAADPEPWFPHASIWPFTIGIGAVLVGNGLLLGLWFTLPAAAVLAAAIIGFLRQSRQRS